MAEPPTLTAEQLAAAQAPDGPLLIVAGPGAGKTAVLAARIAHLIRDRGVGPASILALTFAAKAARDLRERLDRQLGAAGADVDIATFHSFGLRIVRRWPTTLGYRPGPLVVYGEARARALLREVATAFGVDLARIPLAVLARAVEQRRLAVSATPASPLAALAAAYEAALARRNALDFPAMLALPGRLLSDDSPAAKLLRTAYRVVLVDECQDMGRAEYALVGVLAAGHRQLALVGDPAQALYGWRGADGAVLRRFLRDFPETRLAALRRTFRSTPEIVALANAVGARLPGRQTLWTANPSGPLPVVGTLRDEGAEAAYVAEEIARLLQIGAIRDPAEVAILCRVNAQAPVLSSALRARGIRCCARGDLVARREVRDALAYLRLAHDPDDADALRRIVDVPSHGLARFAPTLRAHPAPRAALTALAGGVGPVSIAARDWLLLLDALHREAAGLAPAAALDLALDRGGYRAWLAAQPDGAARLAHLAALRRLAALAEGDLGDWLAALALGDVDEAGEAAGVRLLTVHGAKGREWPVVFLIGWEEGLLPHRRALEAADAGGLAEERRVAYVAVTRPRQRLYVTCCRERAWGDGREARRPSRFLLDLAGALGSPAA